VALNFTPEVRRDYRFRVPVGGAWRELLNTDAAIYGGGNVGNAGAVQALRVGDHFELSVVLPPLGGVFLVPQNTS
jgi:1,4-alpha-glucan branching enzyme